MVVPVLIITFTSCSRVYAYVSQENLRTVVAGEVFSNLIVFQ